MAAVPEKANRRELCEIICTQKEKLQRYEARLGDLVRAYKSLQKEKDALELSLKALTSSKANEKARASTSNESLTEKKSEKTSEPTQSSSGAGSQSSYAKGQESSAELDRLRQQVKDLQGQLRTQRAQFEAQEQSNRETTAKLQRALSDADLRHEQERQRLEQRWSSKLSELESLMQAQRDRSLALVEEKDRELQALRATLASLESENQRYDWQAQREVVSSSGLAVDVSGDREGSSDAQGDGLDPLLSELLSKNVGFASKDGKSKTECQLLHYAQELARKDAELLRTLREKRDVESALRDLQRSLLLKEQKDAQERETLRLRLSQLEHMPGPSDSGKVNLQYLKNVVLQYLLCNEAPARKHMLNAIAVGLRFTPREAQLARQAAQAWW
ncbi:hypothetical protein MTO96_016984 [Rhipicephalus appendiculatus]